MNRAYISNFDQSIKAKASVRGVDRDVFDPGATSRLLYLLGLKNKQQYSTLFYDKIPVYFGLYEKKQRCIFQFRITNSNNIKNHLAYLKREGTAIDGNSGAAFFNELSDDVSLFDIEYSDEKQIEPLLFQDRTEKHKISKEISKAKKSGEEVKKINYLTAFCDAHNEEKSFRFLLSPEYGEKLPMEEFTKIFMGRLSYELSTNLTWVSVIHYDTAHPHAHILIRGLNEYRDSLYINKEILFQEARNYARDILTNGYLGERTEFEISDAYQNEIRAKRVTSLDKILLTNSSDNDDVVIFSLFHSDGYIGDDLKQSLSDRLKYLQELGLATKIDAGRFKLDSLFHASLRDMAVQKDIVRKMSSMEHLSSKDRKILTAKEGFDHFDNLYGKIIYRHTTGSLEEDYIIYIETSDKSIYAHRLNKKQSAVLTAKVNSFCSILKPGNYSEIDKSLLKVLKTTLNLTLTKENVAAHFNEDFYKVRRRLLHLADGGICKINEPVKDKIDLQFSNDSAEKIDQIKPNKEFRTVIESNVDVAKDIKTVGLTFLDKYIMYQTKMDEDFIVDENGEVFNVSSVLNDGVEKSNWFEQFTSSACKRIEYHISQGDIWISPKDSSLRFQKGFAETLWKKGSEFSILAYQQKHKVALGAIKMPTAEQQITGTVYIDEKQEIVYIKEVTGGCVVMPLIESLRKNEGEIITFKYPKLLERNKNSTDFYLKIDSVILPSADEIVR